MKDLFYSALSIYREFSSCTFNMIFYWIAVIYLCTRTHKKQKNLIGFSVLLVVFLLIPPFVWLVSKVSFGGAGLINGFYALPVVVIVALFATQLVMDMPKKIYQYLIYALFAALLLISVNFNITRDYLYSYANYAKVSEDIVEISRCVRETSDDQVLMLAPQAVNSQIREYDEDIILYCVSDTYDATTYSDSAAFFAENAQNYEAVCTMAKADSVDYIVWPKDVDEENEIERYGYKFVTDTDNYAVYMKE